MIFEDKETGIKFEYEIIRRRVAKNLKVKIGKDCRVEVVVPAGGWRYVTNKYIEKFLLERKEFITSALSRYRKLAKRFPDLFNFSVDHYRRHRKMAEELIKSKVDYFCRRMGFRYNRISIRNQKTRWGSCSSRGNLNFSYRLIFLSPEEQDYIVVHELCHLKEQNHSRKFWALVEEILPDYKKIHKTLQRKS